MNRMSLRKNNGDLLDILGHTRVYHLNGNPTFKRFIKEWRKYDFNLYNVKFLTRIEYSYNRSLSIRHFISFYITPQEDNTQVVRIIEQRYYTTLNGGINHGLDVLFALNEFSSLKKYQKQQEDNRKRTR